MTEPTPDVGLKAQCLRPAWTALAVLALLISFVSLYPLGEYGGATPIRALREGQGKVLLIVAPIGFALVVGAATAFLPARPGKRFLVSLACFFTLHSTVLVRHFAFTPLYVWCSGAIPNPISLGIMVASAGAATLTSQTIRSRLEKGFPPTKIATAIVALAAIVAVLSVSLTAPYFAVQWRPAPSVLNSSYTLAWDMAVPVQRSHPAAGFWFPARQAPQYQASTIGPLYGPPSPVALTQDGLFVTEGFMARVRLTDGSVLWSREYDFGGLEQDGFPYYNAFAVLWQGDRLYVVNRSAGWDVFAFDWGTGEPIWEARKPQVRRYRPNEPSGTVVVTSQMILTIPEDGKPEYEVIDPETGAATRHALPAPDGMILADVPSLGSWHSLGPYLVEGADGTVAVLAFFAPPGASVVERLPDDGPPPDRGCLFGLDPATGEIAWRILEAGDWRMPGARFGKNFMVTRDLVVRWDHYDTGTGPSLKAWDASIGKPLWQRSFPFGAQFLVSPDAAIVCCDRKETLCLDARTGALRWQYEDPSLSDLSQLFLCEGTVVIASPTSVRGVRLLDGTEVFRSDAPPGTRLAAWSIREGAVEIRAFAGTPDSGAASSFVDLCTGETVPPSGILSAQGPQGPHLTQGYLFAASAGSLPAPSRTLNGIVPMFKAEGTLGPISCIGEPPTTCPSSGEVTSEGWVLLTSFDPKSNSYRVYMLEPVGR